MVAVGESFRNAGVSAIYLIHGTFIGNDTLGVSATLSAVAPGFADIFRGWSKELLDSIAGDIGNFTRRHAELLQSAWHLPGAPDIPVRLFHWSSENHHLGRADAAVRLLNEIHLRAFPPGSRVLILGHSHGGNVLAILTNLLASHCELRKAFFAAARCFFRVPILRRIDMPTWQAMQEVACREGPLLPGVQIDIATLGTPVRYGWDTGGCDHLLHFINHRSAPGLPEYQAPFPPKSEDLWNARYGDFVQQCGIAGTNLAPPVWAWRACDADVRLGRLLQPPEYSVTNLIERLRLGVRAHADGENLLIDYGLETGTPAQHIFGHAVYTRESWLLFHTEQIAQRMYGLAPAEPREAARAGKS